jgi:alkylation response protein AidB-like acyl-CoA dehydrogenase
LRAFAIRNQFLFKQLVTTAYIAETDFIDRTTQGSHAAAVLSMLRHLAATIGDRVPLPGGGATLERWRTLARVAEIDLSLAKLFESHLDAIAILRELGAPCPSGRVWGIWASEGGNERLQCERRANGTMVLNGPKHWCSAAHELDYALVTAWHEERGPYLVSVDLSQPGVSMNSDRWKAVGMAATATADVVFDGAVGTQIGECGAYLSRAGFWHGAAGIAACWYGGAQALSYALAQRYGLKSGEHTAAHLGAVDIALCAARCVLRECAAAIDAAPSAIIEAHSLRVRGVVEAAAESVLRHTGRALGAAPYCEHDSFARHAADLPVFLRQSHAERDLAILAQRVHDDCGWTL